jgi:predicted SprT family Zn-dependent metalloprotease
VRKPPLNPEVADIAPDDAILTPYDYEHIVIYLRLLDANAEDADWQEVSRIVLHIDPEHEPARARRAHETHFAEMCQVATELP